MTRDRYTTAPLPEREAEYYDLVRQAFEVLEDAIDRTVCDGRHKALAITSLETAAAWVRAGLREQARRSAN